MDRRNSLGTGLLVLAAVLFTVPALFPVQAVLIHDTGPGTFDDREQLEEQGIEILAYENMSERGQELYVRTLEADGEYHVPAGDGAPDFEYMTAEERARAREEGGRLRPGVVAIERPPNSDLPRADEPFDRGGPETDNESDRRQAAQRYDLMETSRAPPPLGAVPQLVRLAAAILAVVATGCGGYLLASK